MRRRGPDADYLSLLNHGDEPVQASAAGTDLLTGRTYDGQVAIGAGDVLVLRQERRGFVGLAATAAGHPARARLDSAAWRRETEAGATASRSQAVATARGGVRDP